jgi:Zn-dependent protease
LPEFTPDFIANSLTWYVVLLFSLSFHESAHAWMALRMGDDTAARLGRITMNPIAHIDPFGTVLMPLLQVLMGGVPLMAWAKPTPVQANNFKPGMFRKGQILVAGAGPVSNLILAILFTVGFFVFMAATGGQFSETNPIANVLFSGITMNVALAIFNLVPLPPLDGSWIASWGLPRGLATHYDRIVEPYGGVILLALVGSGAIRWIIGPPIIFLQALLFRLAS